MKQEPIVITNQQYVVLHSVIVNNGPDIVSELNFTQTVPTDANITNVDVVLHANDITYECFVKSNQNTVECKFSNIITMFVE